ncbi:uncharacterized protein LOC130340387 isoform X2 [Hyla sarda]|uniref:uncharacterized protein LOC130340387 isoform X2 n=1 Tax=Hyla sarda TaxID=327740 RepID=UPI0024C3FDBA|nr:uncharacterized protein LOC130340387 isoform X2 [Hyla sarda]
MDEEFSIENFTPFITRSRTVTRLLPEPLYPHSPLTNPEKRYGPEFWDRLIRQPSVYNTEVPRSEGLLYTSSTSQNMRTDGKWQQHDHMASPLLEPLPPPSEVFRGKKKKKYHADRGVISVENHIQELRKKQSSIDQLKTMKWGGCNIYEMQNTEGMQRYGARTDQEQDTFFSFLDDVTEQDRPLFNFSPPRSPGGVVFPWMTPKEDVSTCFLDRTYDECESAGGLVWCSHG